MPEYGKMRVRESPYSGIFSAVYSYLWAHSSPIFSAFIADFLYVIVYRNIFSRNADKIVVFYVAFFEIFIKLDFWTLSNCKVLQIYWFTKAAVHRSSTTTKTFLSVEMKSKLKEYFINTTAQQKKHNIFEAIFVRPPWLWCWIICSCLM